MGAPIRQGPAGTKLRPGAPCLGGLPVRLGRGPVSLVHEPPSSRSQPPSVTRTVPSFNPRVPSFKPTGPSFNPTGPSFKPTGPSFKPMGPSFNPMGPSFNPMGPSFNPTGPSFAHAPMRVVVARDKAHGRTGEPRRSTGEGPSCGDELSYLPNEAKKTRARLSSGRQAPRCSCRNASVLAHAFFALGSWNFFGSLARMNAWPAPS